MNHWLILVLNKEAAVWRVFFFQPIFHTLLLLSKCILFLIWLELLASALCWLTGLGLKRGQACLPFSFSRARVVHGAEGKYSDHSLQVSQCLFFPCGFNQMQNTASIQGSHCECISMPIRAPCFPSEKKIHTCHSTCIQPGLESVA